MIHTWIHLSTLDTDTHTHVNTLRYRNRHVDKHTGIQTHK